VGDGGKDERTGGTSNQVLKRRMIDMTP
jgi:hypothetical protein